MNDIKFTRIQSTFEGVPDGAFKKRIDEIGKGSVEPPTKSISTAQGFCDPPGEILNSSGIDGRKIFTFNQTTFDESVPISPVGHQVSRGFRCDGSSAGPPHERSAGQVGIRALDNQEWAERLSGFLAHLYWTPRGTVTPTREALSAPTPALAPSLAATTWTKVSTALRPI